jgi:hypothetical protein
MCNMSLFTIITIYMLIGVVFGMSIESIMTEVDLSENTTNFERFLWITLWPIFTLVFIFGMKK